MQHVKPWKSSKARRLECEIIAYMPLMALKGPNQSNPWSRETRPWDGVKPLRTAALTGLNFIAIPSAIDC